MKAFEIKMTLNKVPQKGGLFGLKTIYSDETKEFVRHIIFEDDEDFINFDAQKFMEGEFIYSENCFNREWEIRDIGYDMTDISMDDVDVNKLPSRDFMEQRRMYYQHKFLGAESTVKHILPFSVRPGNKIEIVFDGRPAIYNIENVKYVGSIEFLDGDGGYRSHEFSHRGVEKRMIREFSKSKKRDDIFKEDMDKVKSE